MSKNSSEDSCDWEAFEEDDLKKFADQAGMDVLICGKGRIYKPEDGTIIHCLCRK